MIALGVLLPPTVVHAQDVSAEQALANHKAMTSVAPRGCDVASDPDEIVVCGRDESAKLRLPFPSLRDGRDGARTATGEMPRASSARTRVHSCGMLAGEMCRGGVGLVSAGPGGVSVAKAPLVLQALAKLIDRTLDVDPAEPLPIEMRRGDQP